MKKRWFMLSAALIVGLSLFAASITYVAKEEKQVDVMFIHDVHSHLNEFSTVENGKTQVLGGLAKIKTLINAQKEINPDTLILDAGDFSMGTLVQVIYEEEAAELRMLGELGVEATTLGNHEFDYLSSGLANMMNSAVDSGDDIPAMVLCNVDWDAMNAAGLNEEQQLLADAFAAYDVCDYIVVEKNDVTIAITGVFGKDSLACSPTCALLFEDPVEAVQETVEKIKEKEDADMIVCVSHSGTWEDPDKSEDEILAKRVPELDLIVSGHTHTKLDKPIQHGDTFIVSAGEYGKYLGSLSMSQKSDGRWRLNDYELIKIDETIEKDPKTQAKIDDFISRIDSVYLEQFGYTRDEILATNTIEFADSSDLSVLHTEFNLGNIMSDAYTYAVESASDFDGNPVDVTVVPAGTVRDTYPLGNITTENVFHSFSLGIGADGVPGYPLLSVYLSGAELKMIAEIDASVSDFMTTARLYTDGLYWSYNPNRIILNKVTDVYLNNAKGERVEIIDDKLYRVVSDMYSAQMLGAVTDMSYGILSIVPKFADGTPIEDYNKAIIHIEGQELKAWVAIAKYMQSFEDTDGDGIANVPDEYKVIQGRKVVENSKNIIDLVKNPNQFFFIIVGAVLFIIILLILLILLAVKFVKKFMKKRI